MNPLAFWMELAFYAAGIGFTWMTWASFDPQNLPKINKDK